MEQPVVKSSLCYRKSLVYLFHMMMYKTLMPLGYYTRLIETLFAPEEIKSGLPGIAIIDNDDFREDTLSGGGTTHTTNMLLLQCEPGESLAPTERSV